MYLSKFQGLHLTKSSKYTLQNLQSTLILNIQNPKLAVIVFHFFPKCVPAITSNFRLKYGKFRGKNPEIRMSECSCKKYAIPCTYIRNSLHRNLRYTFMTHRAIGWSHVGDLRGE